jgi:DNA polymerase
VPRPIQNDPLTELRLDIQVCSKCRLHHDCTQPVPGEGRRDAKIVLIGEAPGFNEDKTGEPFVGNAGKRLNVWLRNAGLTRDEMFITNVLKCRPGRNKFPEGNAEVDKCLPWLVGQLQAVKPLAVILAGKKALEHVVLRNAIGRADPLAPWLGKVLRRRDLYGETRFGVIFHPAYILRTKNPWDEASCIETITKLTDYVRAVEAGNASPMIEIEEIRPAKTVQHQRRLRLFPEAPPQETESDQPE